MGLITCPECKKKISDSADSCPKCGYRLTPEKLIEIKKNEQHNKNVRFIGCLSLTVIIIIITFIGKFSDDSQSTNTSNSSFSIGQENIISGSSWFGCTDRKYFEKLVEYTVQRDEQAFTNALATGILAGTCIMFNDGE